MPNNPYFLTNHGVELERFVSSQLALYAALEYRKLLANPRLRLHKDTANGPVSIPLDRLLTDLSNANP